MTRAQFLELAADQGLMTTSYGGGLTIAGDGRCQVMTWVAERPNGEPLPEPVVILPERYWEAAQCILGARQMLAP
jgi:hypothetical protein